MYHFLTLIIKYNLTYLTGLVYAELQAHDYPALLRIVSKRMNTTELNHFDYGLNSSGDPILVQATKRQVSSRMKGTKVQLRLPIPFANISDNSNDTVSAVLHRG